MIPAYIETIRELLHKTEEAVTKAVHTLPSDLISEHHQARNRGPDAWNHVYHAHICDLLTDPELLMTLFALKQLMEIHTGVSGFLNEYDLQGKPPDLTLGKMRRQ